MNRMRRRCAGCISRRVVRPWLGTPGGQGRLHLHLGQGEELYTNKLMPAVKEGAAASGRDVDDIDKMIEIKISLRPRSGVGAGEHTVLGAVVALGRAEAQHR